MHTLAKYGHSRFWAVLDPAGELVCVCVYKRGAQEVIRRLQRDTLGNPPVRTSHSPQTHEQNTR
ncbi:MAG: hypothetical protein H7A46_07105 [Verrucomicrobiales bacterium]|nr:hypothetical protein [Verrucomicrobiales bacterium]